MENDRDQFNKEVSDIELASRWVVELENNLGEKKLNMGKGWLMQANDILKKMKEKPAGQQDPHAIELLEEAINKYKDK